MFNKFIIVVFGLLISHFASAAKFYCANKTMNENFWFKVTDDKILMETKNESCEMKSISYKPVSEKYKGWIRFAPNTSCTSLGDALFREPSDPNRAIDIHWISVSTEMQSNEDGFAQVGFTNLWDPGAGATSKVFVKCFNK